MLEIISNRFCLVSGFLLLCFFWEGASAEEVTAEERPNILFVFSDDHAPHAIGAYDGWLKSVNPTPNIDSLASQGIVFRNSFCTNSICGPSRAVIQTGKHSHKNGFMNNGNSFDWNQQTFPKLLRKVGYETAMIGKWHLKSVPTGFDYFDVLIGQGPYYNPPMRTTNDAGEVVVEKNTGYTTDIVTDKALAWLKNDRATDKPFMLMLQHKAPHRNWQPGPAHLNTFDDVEIPEPETLWDDYSGRTQAAGRQTMTMRQHLNPKDLKLQGHGTMTPEQIKVWDAAYSPKNEAFEKARATMSEKEILQWKYQRYAKDYLRCVKSVDDGVGQVLDYLDTAGLADNTIVIYSSDQGWYLGEHGWFDKRWMYEESLKTPLLVRWPRHVKPGTINNDIVSNLDFPETFLDVAGVDIPSDMQGKSLVPILEGKTPNDWRTAFYYQYYENPGGHNVARHYGVTNGQHKLIHFYALEGKKIDDWELFDLKEDPNELRSVFNDPEYAEVQQYMKSELKRLRKQYAVGPDDDPGRARRNKPKKQANPK